MLLQCGLGAGAWRMSSLSLQFSAAAYMLVMIDTPFCLVLCCPGVGWLGEKSIYVRWEFRVFGKKSFSGFVQFEFFHWRANTSVTN